MEEKLDLYTLRYIKNRFIMFSDYSTNCLGYKSICSLIENIENEEKAIENAEELIESLNEHRT